MLLDVAAALPVKMSASALQTRRNGRIRCLGAAPRLAFEGDQTSRRRRDRLVALTWKRSFTCQIKNVGFITGCVVHSAVLGVQQILECRNLHCRRGNFTLPRWLLLVATDCASDLGTLEYNCTRTCLAVVRASIFVCLPTHTMDPYKVCDTWHIV